MLYTHDAARLDSAMAAFLILMENSK